MIQWTRTSRLSINNSLSLVFEQKETTATDVYAFAITVWELFHPTAERVYAHCTPKEVMSSKPDGRVRVARLEMT